MNVPALAGAAQVVARNAAPLAGILLLGWSARNVLYLYLVDTVLALAVIFAGLLRHFSPPVADDGWAARINGEAGAFAGGLLIALFFAVPLGVMLVIMMGGRLELAETLADPAFRTALGWQVVAAVWSYASLWQALRHRSPDELKLRRRFALVFLRWVALMPVAMVIAPFAGRATTVLLVAAYVLLSIGAELAPDRVLRPLDAPPKGAPPAPSGAAAPRPKRPRGRR